jgi:hypothetical protein
MLDEVKYFASRLHDGYVVNPACPSGVIEGPGDGRRSEYKTRMG